MANAFDFQLKADDQVSQSIQNIDDAIKKLLPQLNNTEKGLQLGGRKSVEGIDEIGARLGGLAKNARDGVQFVGDLVPPLKMVGGLTLGLGGLATVINTVKSGIKDYADSGYKIDSTAKNISTTTRAYQELTGAMIENGATRDAADSAVTGLYKRANDALNSRDDPFNALLAQMGIKISRTKEGMADVVKLMDDLNKAMLQQSPARQAVIAQVGQFSPELLNYLRQSTDQVQRLKDQAQRDGLIFSDKDIQNALAFRTQVNQISASWDGMLMKSEAWLGQAPIVQKSVDDLSQVTQHGLDTATVGSLLDFNRGGQQADRIREASKDEKFKSTLSWDEKLDLNMGYASGDLVKKLNSYYGAADSAKQLQQDVKSLYVQPPSTLDWQGNPRGPQSGPEPTLFPQLETKYNLPRGTLNNVYQAESAGGKNMFSPAGAEGPFQFMPTTGQQYGLKDRADRMDTNKSAEAAAHYLSDLLTQFGGDMKKTIAAYNWGPTRVNNLGLDYAPKETRDYLDRVMPGLPDFYDASNNGNLSTLPPTTGSPLPDSQSVGPSEPNLGNENISINQQTKSDEPNINVPPPKANSPAGANTDIKQLTDALANALKDNKSQIELTLVNGRTGERKKVAGSGGKVTSAMSLP